MMNVGIIGLGLIGGSMAKAIHAHTDSYILGANRSHGVVERALEEGVLQEELTFENADKCDMLIVALYPKDVVEKVKTYAPYLKKGAIVVDCTGVKKFVSNELSKYLSDMGLCFVGGHPMAGKEVAGYANADTDLFNRASMILTQDEYTSEEAFNTAAEFFSEVGFKMIKESTPVEHDKVIAYTSQLCHVVSNAFIKSPTCDLRYGFSAGSFKDLTRVAKLDEYMWTDLFLANKEALLDEINIFMSHMEEYKEALENEDKETLIRILGEGRQLKEDDIKKEQ
ncbi:MAG: prephenate dehydrogenase [Lachnospiraceae bacterium]|nr:prephenate dehydrogenase [Lachnospiraceae bacterium]